MKSFFIVINDLGSFSNFQYEIASKLSVQYKVHVLCSDKRVISYEDPREDLKIEFQYVDIPRSFNLIKLLKAAFRIRRLIKVHRPKFVHTHFLASVVTVILFGKIRDVIYIATFHGLESYGRRFILNWVYSILERLLVQVYDQVIVLNNDDLKKLENYKNVWKLTDYGLGCDLVKFPFKSSADTLTNKPQVVIGYVGRFVGFKGFAIICEIYNLIKKTGSREYKFVLIGGEDPIHRSRFISDSLEFMKLDENVVMPGMVNNVQYYLEQVDIFVFPSIKEGIPVCVMEAMAMGIPVIAFNKRGLNDLINNLQDGILLNYRGNTCLDSKEILNAILALKSDELLLKKIRELLFYKREYLSRNHYVDSQLKFYEFLK